ncbi:hypothetical protein B0I35DRAFT_483414 [Stachybotrys elegans]|uniref:Secreted protein n=1 Tax=Stachybotrys elegans TaxID=80388 RepID=A0A8K0WM29_9HYPO|nr:hypothetical protein B0I35DRAFT_483414 [Stachybotrys elegans]
MRFPTSLFAALASVLGLAVAEPSDPLISSVSHSGSGCPQDSLVEVADGGRAYRLHGFSSRGPGTDVTQNCALHFTVGGEAKYQVSLKHAKVRAHGYFPNGSGLSYYLTNFWTSEPIATTSVSGSWTNNGGAVNGPLVIEIDVPAENRVWSQCGQADIMNPNFRVIIQDTGYYGTRNGLVTTETLTYVWREC